MEYIGIVERNDWEGEEFGYYFEDNPEVRKYLEKIQEDLPEDSEYEVVLDPIDEETLMHIHQHDKNGYMGRVNIYNADEQPWDEILMSDFEEEIPFYKGNCFVNRLHIFGESQDNFEDVEEFESFEEEDSEEEDW